MCVSVCVSIALKFISSGSTESPDRCLQALHGNPVSIPVVLAVGGAFIHAAASCTSSTLHWLLNHRVFGVLHAISVTVGINSSGILCFAPWLSFTEPESGPLELAKNAWHFICIYIYIYGTPPPWIYHFRVFQSRTTRKWWILEGRGWPMDHSVAG